MLHAALPSRGAEAEALPLSFKNIAISRETGTHDDKIGPLVAQALGWHVFDHELIERIAARMEVPLSMVERTEEQAGQRWEDTFAALPAPLAVRESRYARNLVETTLEFAADGNCVFVGRGAAWILPPEQTLRVGLMAPRDHRIQVVMADRKIDAIAAAKVVDEMDERRARFAKAHLCGTVIDPHAYDLVLNTARFSIPQCVEMIVAAAKQRP